MIVGWARDRDWWRLCCGGNKALYGLYKRTVIRWMCWEEAGAAPQPTFHTVHTPHALPSRVCGGCSSKVNGGRRRRGSIWRDRPTFYDFAGTAAFIPLHLTPSQAQTTPPPPRHPPPAGRLNPHQIQLPPPTIRISQSSSAYVSFSCESEFPVPQDLTH